MAFQGEVLSVGALLDAARTTPETTPNPSVGVRHTAAINAAACRTLISDGEALDACWRFGILQTLDDYASALRRGGPDLAAGVFTDEPPRTGSAEVDAAFAALAERDGWQTPTSALDSSRRTTAWYPARDLPCRRGSGESRGVPAARDTHHFPLPGEGMTHAGQLDADGVCALFRELSDRLASAADDEQLR